MASKLLDDWAIQRVAECISLGCTFKASAGAIGITDNTLRKWLKTGEEALENGNEDCMEAKLFKATSNAMKEFEERNLSIIKEASIKSWQAAAWLLERRIPSEFGQRQQIEASIPDRVEIVADVKKDA